MASDGRVMLGVLVACDIVVPESLLVPDLSTCLEFFIDDLCSGCRLLFEIAACLDLELNWTTLL